MGWLEIVQRLNIKRTADVFYLGMSVSVTALRWRTVSYSTYVTGNNTSRDNGVRPREAAAMAGFLHSITSIELIEKRQSYLVLELLHNYFLGKYVFPFLLRMNAQ